MTGISHLDSGMSPKKLPLKKCCEIAFRSLTFVIDEFWHFSITAAMQVVGVVFSFLSLSWGVVTTRALALDKDEYKLGYFDVVLDMIWNLLAISSRVITLALFATKYLDWFIGFSAGQLVVWGIVQICFKGSFFENTGIDSSIFSTVLLCLFGLIGSLVNIFTFDIDNRSNKQYRIYCTYWVTTLIENIVYVTLWYVSTKSENLWYHVLAIAYVIPAYVLSFLIKSLHRNINVQQLENPDPNPDP